MFNPLKPKSIYIIFMNSVHTTNKILHFTIKKINWLMLFKETVAVYTENHNNPSTQNAELLIVKATGYHSALKG
jgi:hypothetical protein